MLTHISSFNGAVQNSASTLDSTALMRFCVVLELFIEPKESVFLTMANCQEKRRFRLLVAFTQQLFILTGDAFAHLNVSQ